MMGVDVDYSKQYFTIVSLEDNNEIGWKHTFTISESRSLYVSTDVGVGWTLKSSTSEGVTLGTLNRGQRLFIRTPYNSVSGYGDDYGYTYFTSTGNFAVEGNIMSLLYEDFDEQTALPNFSGSYAFDHMFYYCEKLINIDNLVMPATTLQPYCYQYMFCNCSALASLPAGLLPATTLADYCYKEMFDRCTSLTEIPEGFLPATSLATQCYYCMFYDCSGISSVPSDLLPATTLNTGCYRTMFYGCTSLETAPDLLASTLVQDCYRSMFYGCSSLNYIKCLATNKSASNCTTGWVNGVAASGTFVKSSSTSWSTGNSAIPSGWTVQNAS